MKYLALFASALLLTSCVDSDVPENRRITFVNVSTEKVMIEIEGRCVVGRGKHRTETRCYTASNTVIRYYSDVSPLSQIFVEPIPLDASNPYKLVYKNHLTEGK